MKNQTVSKPFAGYDDLDACVRDHADEVEDLEAFCAWLQDEAKDALSDPNATEVLTSLTTEFVSSVDRPAQDSEWLLFKDADTPRKKARQVERPYVFAEREEVASKAADVDVRASNEDGEKQIAYAAVLIPNESDKQGDVVPPYVIERSAHEYMAEYRKMDSDHDLEDGAGVPVESWILKDETTFEKPDGDTVTYPPGTWVMGKRFVDDEWKRVKSGDLNGFSIYGAGTPIAADDLTKSIERTASAKGVESEAGDHQNMKNAITDALASNVPHATFADRVQKAEYEDEQAAEVVEMLRLAADTLEEGIGGGSDEEEVEDEYEDGEGEEDEEDEDESMKNEDGTPEDGGTNEGDDGVADGIEELKGMVKSVDQKVGDFDDRLSEVESEVESIKDEAGIGTGAPENDRLNGNEGGDGSDENERMKSVAKEAATEAVAEAFGVEDADDPEVVRKGIREQTGVEGVEGESGTKDTYDGMFDDDEDGRTGVSKSVGTDGNPRLSGGDN